MRENVSDLKCFKICTPKWLFSFKFHENLQPKNNQTPFHFTLIFGNVNTLLKERKNYLHPLIVTNNYIKNTIGVKANIKYSHNRTRWHQKSVMQHMNVLFNFPSKYSPVWSVKHLRPWILQYPFCSETDL